LSMTGLTLPRYPCPLTTKASPGRECRSLKQVLPAASCMTPTAPPRPESSLPATRCRRPIQTGAPIASAARGR
jgi:hypothetical protein